MKDIVIIANFVGGLHGTDNNRFVYLANMLCKENSVELIASTFCHAEKANRTNIVEYPFKVTLLEEPGYKKNICLKRFWSHYIWGRNVIKYLKSRKKPDVVYCAIPSLTAPAKVSEYCKKKGVRFIVDVQDLWPEAFQMVFNVPVLNKLIFLIALCNVIRLFHHFLFSLKVTIFLAPTAPSKSPVTVSSILHFLAFILIF